MFLSNLKTLISGNRIISNQKGGTPGIYKILNVKNNTKYQIILDEFENPNNNTLFLWIATVRNKLIKKIVITNQIKYEFTYYHRLGNGEIKVGVLFKSPNVGDIFYLNNLELNIIEDIDIEEIPEKYKKLYYEIKNDEIVEEVSLGEINSILKTEKNNNLIKIQNKYSEEMQKKVKLQNEKEDVGDFLNIYFDQIYLINMDKDTNRLKRMKKWFEKYGIKFKRISGVVGKEHVLEMKKNFNSGWNSWERRQNRAAKLKNAGAYGCLMSHRKVVQDAVENGYNRILIFEDDILFHKDFKQMIERCENVLNMENWKLIYLGSTQHDWRYVKKLPNRVFYRASHTDSTFCYGMDSSIFSKMLNLTEKPKFPIDFYYRYFQDSSFCPVIFPQCCISKLDESNIRGKRNIRHYANQFRWHLKNYIMD